MFRFLLLLLSITSCLAAHAQNRPLPPSFPNYEFELTELSYTGHYLLNSYELHPETVSNMFIMDSLGYVAWYRKDQQTSSVDFKYHPAANVFSSNGYDESFGGIFYSYDSNFQPLDTIRAVGEERGDTHDFLVLADGHRLIGTLYDTIMDLRGYTFNNFGGVENSVVRGFGIQEFDVEGNLIWTWHSTDHVHPSEFSDGLNYFPFNFDYAHGNAMQVDEDGNLIVSFRNTSTVYKIDRANRTGEVLWRLGGENSTFSISNSHRFSAQHYARVLPNGNIGLYDNGSLRIPIRYSRAAEYKLDFSDFTVNLEWSYDANREVFAPGMGNAQWINDDLVLIGWGYVFRPSPTFSLVNRAGDALAKLYFEDEYITYRVQAAAFPFDLPRPYLSSEVVEGGITLSAPEGYSAYVWSTGETTRSITVTENGTYQAWVPHGIGLVGSYPIEVSEIVSSQELAMHTIEVFPNPATNQLNIHLSTNWETAHSLELYDANGRKVWGLEAARLTPSITINVSKFPSGLYYLKVRTPNSTLTQKVVLL